MATSLVGTTRFSTKFSFFHFTFVFHGLLEQLQPPNSDELLGDENETLQMLQQISNQGFVIK